MKNLTIYLLALLFLVGCGQGQQNDGSKNDTTDMQAEAQQEQSSSDDDGDDEQEEVDLTFPKPSPQGEVQQQIGVTSVGIEYYRPSVKDRQIWGKLVPYDEMWRTGANAATTFEFSNDVMVNGNKLKAGEYSFFTIPKKGEKWTLIFNTKTELWGTRGYDKENDALRFKVDPQDINHHEMMTFSIDHVTDTSGRVALAWKKTSVPFTITTNTTNQVMTMMEEAVEKAGDDDWRTFNDCADYLVDKGKMLGQAEEWVNKSINIKKTWRNHWTKAQLKKEQGNIDEAISLAEEALKIGKENSDKEEFPYNDYMQENIEELKGMKQS